MPDERIVGFGTFRFDPANARLWRDHEVLRVSPKALAVLHYFVEQAGRLVTKDDLFHAVWPGVLVGDAALTICIGELRKVLGESAKAPRFIETVHKRGYRFIAEVVSSQHSGVSSPSSSPTPSIQSSAPNLVGREGELQQLHQLLGKALNGERQLVFVTGEPGIGKTTLIEAFLGGIGNRELGVGPLPPHSLDPKSQRLNPVPWIGRGQCIEHHGAGEAYLPILEALGRLCRAPGGEHLVTLLSQYAPTWLAQLPTLLSADELAALQPKVQGATQGRMLRELAEALEALTAEGPLVLVLEDLHWSDASTVDLLAALARRRESTQLLVLGTYRPVEVLDNGHPLNSMLQELQAHTLCTEVDLGLLTPADIETYLHRRFPTSALPTDLAHSLWHRTSGNPLFLVNIVDDLMARGLLLQVDDRWVLQGGVEAVEGGVPKSIRQLIARQSARLQPAEQRVLEAASIAGMEFSAAAVAAAVEEPTITVEEQCARLVHRQHFLRAAGLSEWPDGTLAARYGFQHALYQQLWHERVSPSRLQQWHVRIGERKEAAYGARAGEIATELAVHFEEGHDYRKALPYCQQAAQTALRRSANIEAIQHLTKGLELLKRLPDTPQRTEQELRLRITQGGPLIATKGFAAPEMRVNYARARELCRQLGEPPQLFPVLWGICAFHSVRAEWQTAQQLAEQLLTLAQSTQDLPSILEAHYAVGQALYPQGKLVQGREHLEQVVKLYDPQQHRPLAFVYGLDPGVMGRGVLAITLWLLGYPDQARETSHATLALGQEVSHAGSLAFALNTVAALCVQCRDERAARERAEELMTLSTAQGFSFYLAFGMMVRGWALTAQGQLEEGIIQLRQGLAAHEATGAENGRSRFLNLLAWVYREVGQVEEGLAELAKAFALVNKTGERFWEAELYRLKGELTLQKLSVISSQLSVPTPHAEAEECFHKAIEIARKQQAKSLELRTVMSLRRLWQQQGKKKEAHNLLSEIYNWFTEGFDTKDLQEAKALLEVLS